MIELTRFDNSKILVNADLIQSLQSTPDTIVTFTTKEKMMVKEAPEEISRRIMDYQRSLLLGALPRR